MRLGLTVPQFGKWVGRKAMVQFVQRAEELGCDSLWVIERLLYPVEPRAPYPATPDGSLPKVYRSSLDPLTTMSFVAAATSRPRIGSCVLNLPFYNPVLLARHLTAIDVLSEGRLEVGFGVGWSPDEFEAVGVPLAGREKRADEAIRLLKAIWTENPVEFSGRHFRLAASHIDLKPVQKPHPPVYMAAYTPKAMSRVARHADGWLPAGVPIDGMRDMFAAIRGMARDAGRDPGKLELVPLGNVEVHEKPRDGARMIFTGSLAQIAEDVAAVRKLGASELVLNVQFSPGLKSLDDLFSLTADLWKVIESER